MRDSGIESARTDLCRTDVLGDRGEDGECEAAMMGVSYGLELQRFPNFRALVRSFVNPAEDQEPAGE